MTEDYNTVSKYKYRGFWLKTNYTNFWNDCQKCFKSNPLYDTNVVEEWFTENQNHDIVTL